MAQCDTTIAMPSTQQEAHSLQEPQEVIKIVLDCHFCHCGGVVTVILAKTTPAIDDSKLTDEDYVLKVV